MLPLISRLIRKIPPFLWPLILGLLAFLMTVGPRPLIFTNIAWLGRGDPATHYLGWLFFRNSPWSFPIGLNPNYGIEISNGIIYSDSNPLLAFFFKPFAAILPEPFQYFGIWLLICFILQSWLSWKLIGLISNNSLVRFLGSGLFVFSPPMIWRLHENIGHLSLVGHFFILAAIYLSLTKEISGTSYKWGILLFFVSLVHPYLLFSVLIIWVANYFDQLINFKKLNVKSVLEASGILIFATFACWLAGYFTVIRGLSLEGFGSHGTNLLAFFDPGRVDYRLWSYFLIDISGDGAGHEGFNFAGAGILLLLPFALLSFVRSPAPLILEGLKRRFLLFSLIILWLFALSNNISIGAYQIHYEIPTSLMWFVGMFRASARMFWPLFYVLIFATIFLVIRGYGAKKSILIMAIAFLIQVADTSAGWRGIHKHLSVKPSSTWVTPLKDPFWVEAASRYKKIHVVPLEGQFLGWQDLAYFAGTHHMSIDGVYLARIDRVKLDLANQTNLNALRTGKYDPDSIYILSETVASAAAVNPVNDLLLHVDGFIVLAPNWRK